MNLFLKSERLHQGVKNGTKTFQSISCMSILQTSRWPRSRGLCVIEYKPFVTTSIIRATVTNKWGMGETEIQKYKQMKERNSDLVWADLNLQDFRYILLLEYSFSLVQWCIDSRVGALVSGSNFIGPWKVTFILPEVAIRRRRRRDDHQQT